MTETNQTIGSVETKTSPRRSNSAGDSGVDAPIGQQDIDLLRLHFSDILGRIREAEIPGSQLHRAFDRGIPFDGSAIESFLRTEEPEVLLKPDPETLRIPPKDEPGPRIATAMCDVHRPNGAPFEGDPRSALKRVLGELSGLGFSAHVGAELEFYLLEAEPSSLPLTGEHLAVGSATAANRVRCEVVRALESAGIEVEATYPTGSSGQHALLLGLDEALTAADTLHLVGLTLRSSAARHGLCATLMPKPLFEERGSGLHLIHSLRAGERDAFHDPDAREGRSDVFRFYVGGLLQHARALTGITNPLVNSYKRLVAGDAPSHAAWSLGNQSAMLRVTRRDDEATRLEVRTPDPAVNPYLTIAVLVAAGMDGLRNEIAPGEPASTDLRLMGERERRRLRIQPLPRDLGEALDELEGSRVLRGALGEYLFAHFAQLKRAEWDDYSARVHPWELERYLGC